MKPKIIILLLVLIQISCTEKNDLEGSWILVDQKAKPSLDAMQVLRGLLVDFKNDQLKFSFLTSKEETVKKFWIEDQVIKYDSLTFGKIIQRLEQYI